MRNPISVINKFYSRLLKLFILIVLFVFVSIVGLMIIEHMSFLESLWTVTNLVTTVGSSIRPFESLSVEGRIFIIFIMWVGIFIFLMAITIIASNLLQGKYQQAFKLYNMEKKLNTLDNHIIICGFGRNGRQAARKLTQYHKKFIVIDMKDFEPVSGEEFEHILFYKGDATLDSTLQYCGIERASAIITALPSDADNLFVVLTSHQLNPQLKIISRASNSESIKKLKIAGADNVIMPDKIGGEHMASLVVTPDLVEFIDQINFEGSNNKNLLEVPTNSIANNYLEKDLGNFLESIQTSCKVIGYKDKEGEYTMNPDLNDEIQSDEYIIFFGRNEQIKELKKELNLN